MARELRAPFRVFRGSDYAAVVEAMRAGHSEIAYLGPASYGLARRVMGERIAPIFRYIDNEGMEGYYSAMIVKADSPIRQLADMRGKTLGFSDPNSTSGFQVPGWFLRRQGMDPATFFSRTGFTGSHEQGVMAVINGTFDAAVLAYSNERRNTFQRMVEKGMIPDGAVRVIWTSPLIPNSPIVMRMDLPVALREEAVAAFAALPERDPQAFRDMSSNARGIAPAKHEDYLDIVAILEDNAARRRERRS
jgi:phosphonate transport system substrate-binding protein